MKIYKIAQHNILTPFEISNGTTSEYKIDWLERHESQYFKNGGWTFYHATPRDTFRNMQEIRSGSLMTDSIENAIHYAGRDRDLSSNKMVVFELVLNPNEFDTGIFPSLAKDMPINSPSVKLVKG